MYDEIVIKEEKKLSSGSGLNPSREILLGSVLFEDFTLLGIHRTVDFHCGLFLPRRIFEAGNQRDPNP